MKNYDEMANNVFERRDQYEIEKKQKGRCSHERSPQYAVPVL